MEALEAEKQQLDARLGENTQCVAQLTAAKHEAANDIQKANAEVRVTRPPSNTH